MKKSEVIEQNRDKIMEEMAREYLDVLECGGRIQYSLYIWEDGELEILEQAQGDNTWLQPKDWVTRKLYGVTEVSEPNFDPWDSWDTTPPEDEKERDEALETILDWYMDEYKRELPNLLDAIIKNAEFTEKYLDEED